MTRQIIVDHDRFDVLQTSQFGDPLRVAHVEECMRGSFIETWQNASLALYQVRVAWHRSLPTALQNYIAQPSRWWREQE
jgi:hypothetical protein